MGVADLGVRFGGVFEEFCLGYNVRNIAEVASAKQTPPFASKYPPQTVEISTKISLFSRIPLKF